MDEYHLLCGNHCVCYEVSACMSNKMIKSLIIEGMDIVGNNSVCVSFGSITFYIISGFKMHMLMFFVIATLSHINWTNDCYAYFVLEVD